MWSWHHWSGVGILVQNQQTLALRVIDVPDPGLFTAKQYAEEDAAAEACQQYVDSVVAKELRANERRVPLGESVRMSREGEPEPPSVIPCPDCRALLYWHYTGIS